MSFQMADMRADDYDEVLALWQATEGVGLNDADAQDFVTAYLARNPGLSLVARRAGKIVGAVLCGHDGRRGYLHHLAVARSHRRQGIGRSLAEACLARLAVAGIRKCNLFVYGDNDAGQEFWRRIGWAECGNLRMMAKDMDPTTAASNAVEAALREQTKPEVR